MASPPRLRPLEVQRPESAAGGTRLLLFRAIGAIGQRLTLANHGGVDVGVALAATGEAAAVAVGAADLAGDETARQQRDQRAAGGTAAIDLPPAPVAATLAIFRRVDALSQVCGIGLSPPTPSRECDNVRRYEVVKKGGLVPFVVVADGGHIEERVEAFLRSLVINGYSTYTIRSYAYALADYYEWLCANNLNVSEVSTTNLSSYIESKRLPNHPSAASTCNHRLSVVSAHHNFLIKTASEEGIPWTGMPNPVPSGGPKSRGMPLRSRTSRRRAELRQRVPHRVTQEFSSRQISLLYESAKCLRDRCILKLLEWSGQRIGDWSDVHGRHGILGLSISDIDLSQRLVSVILKGTRSFHTVPVAEDFWVIYRSYLNNERDPNSGIFAWSGHRKAKGKPLNYNAFENKFRIICKRAGLSNINIHRYRHTFAHNLLRTTNNLALTQTFLAHSSPETTANIYGHASMEDLVRAVQQLETESQSIRASDHRPEYALNYDRAVIFELERLFDETPTRSRLADP